MTEPYDVCLVVPSLGRSGGLRVLAEWAGRLAGSGRRVAVCAAARGPGAAMLGPAVALYSPGWAGHARDEVELRLRRTIEGQLADLRVYPRAARRHLPRARRYVLGFAPWSRAMRLEGPVLTYVQHWEPVWFEGTPAAAAVAESSMHAPGPKVVNSSWLRAHWPAEDHQQLHLVHPGVDLQVYRPPAGAGPTDDDQPAGARRPLRVAALGREDVAWKGLAELRAAIAASHLCVELMLFGTSTRGVTNRPWGREVALGGLAPAALAALFRDVDVAVTPSWFESFPLPPLEAMACGTAVVTTREGTEDYAVHQQNALVVPGRDVPALAAALCEVAADPRLRQRLGEAGRVTAEGFSWAAGYAMFERALAATG